MLEKQDKVIAGVSGGPDSVCLLLMLLKLKEEWELSLLAVHVHHGIRGKAADEDEAFVRELCRKWKVELRVFREDVPGYARLHRLSLEEAGREVRRRCFAMAGEEWKDARIALAHHQDDQAETLLLNLCRGCQIRGLRGILPREGRYIRPLLLFRKQEIESYLKKREFSYCTDETNLEEAYARNKIRRRVIPYLEEEINSQAVRHMARTMEEMQKLSEYLGWEAERFLAGCSRWEKGGLVILEEAFQKIPEALRSYVLMEALCLAEGWRKGVETAHIRLLEELMGKQTGKRLDLPGELKAERRYEGIFLFRQRQTEAGKERADEAPAFRSRVFERKKEGISFPVTPYTKWFDYDIIKSTVKFRHREPGDYLTIDRQGNTQKLKQYFINEKIPREERDRIWLAADGPEILWVVGYRQNQRYQITDRTTRILEIEYYGGEKDGGKDQSVGSGR